MSSQKPRNDDPAKSKRQKSKSSRPRNWRFIFRITVAVIVAAAVVYTAINSSKQLSESDFDFRNVSYVWWFAALAAYCTTLVFSAMFWHWVLLIFKQQPAFKDSLLAFFASQLGKYIPGKAMVVVIRTDMIQGDHVKAAPAVASVFVETLTWIFVGSLVGGLLLITQFPGQTILQISAVVLALVAGVLTWPPVFRRIASKLSPVSEKRAAKIFGGLNLKSMTLGWALMLIGWCLNGLSLWLILAGIPGTDVVAADFSLTLACVSLATVAGFVSLLPGGIGVRELVMIPLLGARFGSVTAIVAAVMIRLVWMGAEVLLSGIAWGIGRLR